MKLERWKGTVVITGLFVAAAAGAGSGAGFSNQDDARTQFRRRAKNVILFIGDGMGISTVGATRTFSVGVAGQLVMDQFPYTALSKTYSADSITADSAPTASAMMTGSTRTRVSSDSARGTEPR